MKNPTSQDITIQPFEDLSDRPVFALVAQKEETPKRRASAQKKATQTTPSRHSYHDIWRHAWKDDEWTGAHPFQYAPEQKAAILAALPGHRDGSSVLRDILKLAREYLSEVEHRKEAPNPSEITAQIDNLEKCVEQLQVCLWGRGGKPALHGPTVGAIDCAVSDYFLERTGNLPEETVHSLIPKLKTMLRVFQSHLWIAQRAHTTKRGKVAKSEPLLVLLDQLCTVWESCGNRLSTRAFDDRYSSRLRRFCDAVLKPLPGLESYREALKIVLKRKHAYRAALLSEDHGGNSL